MKGFKNLVILLICALAFALATPKAEAIAISDSPSFSVNTFWNYNWTFTYRYDKNYFSRYNDWSKKNVSITYKSSASPFASYIWNWGNAVINKSFMGSYVKNSWYLTLKAYDISYNLLEESIPFAWVSENFDWTNVLLTNIWFWNNTFILYDDNLTHTLQYIWNYKIKDYIIFLDPLTETLESASYDNFYLISIPQKKAWSLKLLITHLDNIFYWNLSDYDIKTFPYTSSYTLTQITWSTIFPKYTSYMSSNNSYIDNDIWFLYNKDSVYISPDFDWWTSEDTENWQSNMNISLVNNYNQCVNKWENLRKALQLASMCKLQGETAWENIIIDTWLNYTWSYSYCIDLDSFIASAYNIYSWNWNNSIINENVNLQDNTAPFNDLIFSWYYNSVFIDNNNNISWLPNGNSRCSAYTVSSFYDSEKSTIEKISDSITDFFWEDIAWIYKDSIESHTTFSWLIASLSAWTSWFFNWYLFDPYITQFNSWYNKFYSAVNLSGCTVIKQTFPDTAYWDIVFFVAVVSLIFIFIKLL